MRLRKRIISAFMATCIATMMPLTGMASQTAYANAEEAETTTADEVINAPNTEEECGIKVNSLIVAGTYYGVDGKFPIYAEYDATGVINYPAEDANRQNLKLVVTKEDGTEFIADEDFGSFRIKDCTGFENGQSYKLDFSVKYMPSGEGTDGLTLFSVQKTVTFIEQESWSACNYLPAGEGIYDLDLYVHNTTAPGKDEDDGSDGYSVSGISLIDKNGQTAACTESSEYLDGDSNDPRYGNILYKSYYLDGMDIYHADCRVYCTRELEAGEELEAVYYIDGKMHKTGIKLTVTDKPYIKEADRYNRYIDSNIYGVRISAYNTDFDKLSLSFKDIETGEILASSIKFIQEYNDSAVYYIQCNNGELGNGLYNIEYKYSENGTDIIAENVARYYYMYNNIYSNNTYTYSAAYSWNCETDSIEYYDSNIPSGSAISYEIKSYEGTLCTSGGSIIADNDHVVIIPLKKELENGTIHHHTELPYYLYITYTDINGKSNISYSTVMLRFFPGYYHTNVCGNGSIDFYYGLDNNLYLPDSKELEFSIKIKCYNQNELKDTCTAVIYDTDDRPDEEDKIGTVELSLKNENGNLSYNGIYKGSLNSEKNRYYLFFNPYQDGFYFSDGDRYDYLSCVFKTADSNRLCLENQYNYLASGEVLMCFPSEEIADFYCGEGDIKIKDKLKVKILDFQENEIGTYKFANNDFTITGEKFYRVINFSSSVRQKLSNINYCKVYLYYGNGEEKDTIIADSWHPQESFYDTEYDSDNIYRAEYIKRSQTSGWLALGNNESIAINDNIYSDNIYIEVSNNEFSTIYGSESAFPAIITITGWYNNLKTIKTINVPEPGYKFTESDMEGLSPIKKYNFFLKGADGSAIAYRNNYIIKSDEPENDKPDDNKPDDNDNTNNNPGSGTGIIIPYPSVPTGAPGTTATPVPGVTPEATATPVPSVTPEISGSPAPTAVPEASGSPQESAIPEVSAAPVETVAPEVSGTPVPGETESTKNNIKKGTKTVDKKSKAIYKVTKTGKNKTAEYIESTKQTPVNVTIPNSVKINGSVYKVTSVGADAFKNNKKLKSVQIGKNVISIGKKAFYGCKKLRTITVRTNKLKSASIGKNAFGNGFSSPQVKAVKSKWKLYKKIFQAKGMSKKSKFKKL